MNAAAALVSVLKGDATLISLAGPDEFAEARVEEGWPDDPNDPSSLPRITLLVVVPGALIGAGTDVRRARVQVDQWVPQDVADPTATITAIDERLIALLHGKTWSYNAWRYHAVALAPKDFPAPPGGVRRRSRDFSITAYRLA